MPPGTRTQKLPGKAGTGIAVADSCSPLLLIQESVIVRLVQSGCLFDRSVLFHMHLPILSDIVADTVGIFYRHSWRVSIDDTPAGFYPAAVEKIDVCKVNDRMGVFVPPER